MNLLGSFGWYGKVFSIEKIPGYLVVHGMPAAN